MGQLNWIGTVVVIVCTAICNINTNVYVIGQYSQKKLMYLLAKLINIKNNNGMYSKCKSIGSRFHTKYLISHDISCVSPVIWFRRHWNLHNIVKI